MNKSQDSRPPASQVEKLEITLYHGLIPEWCCIKENELNFNPRSLEYSEWHQFQKGFLPEVAVTSQGYFKREVKDEKFEFNPLITKQAGRRHLVYPHHTAIYRRMTPLEIEQYKVEQARQKSLTKEQRLQEKEARAYECLRR